MHRSIGVNVNIGSNATGGLGFEDAVERGGGTLREIHTGCETAVVGQYDVQAVLVQNMHGDAIEEIAVLTEDVGFRSFAHDGSGRQYEHVLEFLNRDVQSDSLTRSESPDQECLTVLLIASRLIRQRDEEIERAAGDINGIREMPNLERLVQRWPMQAVVLGEFHLNRPVALSRLLQIRSLSFEGMPLEIQRMMIRQHRQQLSGLDLLTEINLEFLDFVDRGIADF